MKPVYLLTTAACAIAAASLFQACQSGATFARVTKQITTPEGGKPYVVATEKTAFYRYSPKQGNGPDSELTKDTVVNLIRSSFGYSKVKVAATGEQGFVSSEDIMRASPALLASLSATPAPQIAGVTTSPISTESTEEHLDVRDTDASLVPPPETLPPPDLPPPALEPTP